MTDLWARIGVVAFAVLLGVVLALLEIAYERRPPPGIDPRAWYALHGRTKARTNPRRKLRNDPPGP